MSGNLAVLLPLLGFMAAMCSPFLAWARILTA